ncbi:MAG: hypothetical protein J07HX64_00540 [halophilic archaeon J07HX64]|jgi:hypothetical protein|nr:MAG: hypothetical protein J07HX64_00540 [halophilic archaeon J07HX64]
MEESVSGFKTRGGWVKIVEHGERITHALQQYAEECSLRRGRPHRVRRLAAEKSRAPRRGRQQENRTAGPPQEGKGEQAGKNPDEDLQTAGQKLAESYESLDDPDEAVSKWGESIDYVARAADSAGRKPSGGSRTPSTRT